MTLLAEPTSRVRLNATTRRDPMGIGGLQRSYKADVKRRFARVLREIRTSIVTNDCFGIAHEIEQTKRGMIGNRPIDREKYKFTLSELRVAGFMEWLEELEAREILDVRVKPGAGSYITSAWDNTFIESTHAKHVTEAYERAIRDSRRDLSAKGYDVDGEAPVRARMGHPIHVDKIGLAYSRTYDDLKTVLAVQNEAIRASISEGLREGIAKGIAEGRNPREIARALMKDTERHVNKIGRVRALMIARTETARAYHKANMAELRMGGALGVTVTAEMLISATACPICVALEADGPYTLDEAEDLIPVHPNCRCRVFATPPDWLAPPAPTAPLTPTTPSVPDPEVPEPPTTAADFLAQYKARSARIDREIAEMEALHEEEVSRSTAVSDEWAANTPDGFDEMDIYLLGMRVRELHRGATFDTVPKTSTPISFDEIRAILADPKPEHGFEILNPDRANDGEPSHLPAPPVPEYAIDMIVRRAELLETQSPTHSRIMALQASRRDLARSLLVDESDTAIELQLEYEGLGHNEAERKKSQPWVDEVEKARTFVDQFTRDDSMWDPTLARPVKFYPSPLRAHFSIRNGIRMTQDMNDVARVSVHELAHTLEFYRSDVLKASRKWLDERTGTEHPVDLGELFPDKYDPDELALIDDFAVRGGSSYSGKYYGAPKRYGDIPPGAPVGYTTPIERPDFDRIQFTELISTGYERMYLDPVAFAEEDPEFFNFVMKIAHGETDALLKGDESAVASDEIRSDITIEHGVVDYFSHVDRDTIYPETPSSRNPDGSIADEETLGDIDRLLENIYDELLATGRWEQSGTGRADKARDKRAILKFIEDEIREGLRNTEVVNRASLSVVDDILAGGRIKTQFETGESTGALAMKTIDDETGAVTFSGSRVAVEKIGFGITAENTPHSKRPVYGYLEVDGPTRGQSAHSYGGVRIVFKDTVRPRTTITVDDSFNGMLPAPLNDADLGIVADHRYPELKRAVIFALTADRNDFRFRDTITGVIGDVTHVSDIHKPTFSREAYVEAQIHGGVGVDDIERIELDITDVIGYAAKDDVEWLTGHTIAPGDDWDPRITDDFAAMRFNLDALVALKRSRERGIPVRLYETGALDVAGEELHPHGATLTAAYEYIDAHPEEIRAYQISTGNLDPASEDHGLVLSSDVSIEPDAISDPVDENIAEWLGITDRIDQLAEELGPDQMKFVDFGWEYRNVVGDGFSEADSDRGKEILWLRERRAELERLIGKTARLPDYKPGTAHPIIDVLVPEKNEYSASTAKWKRDTRVAIFAKVESDQAREIESLRPTPEEAKEYQRLFRYWDVLRKSGLDADVPETPPHPDTPWTTQPSRADLLGRGFTEEQVSIYERIVEEIQESNRRFVREEELKQIQAEGKQTYDWVEGRDDYDHIRRAFLDEWGSVVDASRPVIRAPLRFADDIVEDGRFKSEWEVREETGDGTPIGQRVEVEYAAFGDMVDRQAATILERRMQAINNEFAAIYPGADLSEGVKFDYDGVVYDRERHGALVHHYRQLERERKGLPAETLDIDLGGTGFVAETSAQLRPIYGYLEPREQPGSIADYFGDVRFVLKEEIKDRATFTFGDSFHGTLPTPLREPGLESFKAPRDLGGRSSAIAEYVSGERDSFQLMDATRDVIDGGPWETGFAELQIHGGVTLDSVERIEVPRVGIIGRMSDDLIADFAETAEQTGSVDAFIDKFRSVITGTDFVHLLVMADQRGVEVVLYEPLNLRGTSATGEPIDFGGSIYTEQGSKDAMRMIRQWMRENPDEVREEVDKARRRDTGEEA